MFFPGKNSHFGRLKTNFCRFQKWKAKKKKKKERKKKKKEKVLTSFYNFFYFCFKFSFSTFPFTIFLLFLSIFTPFPLPLFSRYVSKNFPVRSQKSLGALCPLPPCPPPPPVTPLHEMPLHLMQRKSQWKTSKVQNEASKFQFYAPLNKEVFNSVCTSSGQVHKEKSTALFVYLFFCTNDVHACYNVVKLFEVFMIKQLYFVNFVFLFPPKLSLPFENMIISVVTLLHTIIIYLNQFSQQNYFKIPKVSEYSPIFPQNSQYYRWRFTALKIPGNFASLI